MTTTKRPVKKVKRKNKAGTSQASVDQRYKIFVEQYIATNENGTKAALAAGYSEKSAAAQASRLLNHAKVKQMLADRRSELAAKYRLTTEDIIKDLAKGLHFDPRKLFRADGSLIPVPELDEDTASMLAGLEVVEMAGGMELKVPGADGGEATIQHIPMYTKKVKWLDKNALRAQAMRHLGMFEKDNEQKRDPITELVAALGGNVLGVNKAAREPDDTD